MNTLKVYSKALFIQFIFIAILFLFITGVRLFDNKSYTQLLEEYKQYALFDTDISLVTEGEWFVGKNFWGNYWDIVYFLLFDYIICCNRQNGFAHTAYSIHVASWVCPCCRAFAFWMQTQKNTVIAGFNWGWL